MNRRFTLALRFPLTVVALSTILACLTVIGINYYDALEHTYTNLTRLITLGGSIVLAQLYFFFYAVTYDEARRGLLHPDVTYERFVSRVGQLVLLVYINIDAWTHTELSWRTPLTAAALGCLVLAALLRIQHKGGDDLFDHLM